MNKSAKPSFSTSLNTRGFDFFIMVKAKLTEKQIKNIQKLLKEGIKPKDLVKKYGVHISVIYRRAKYDYQARGIPVDIKNKVVKTIEQGYTKAEAAQLYNTHSLSDSQANLLISYAESGGNIVAFGEIGSHDEEGNEVERALLSSLLIEGSNDFGLGKFVYSGDLPTREDFGGILSGLIPPCIQTNANENVVMIEYWNNETCSIIIHLINYNYDIETQHLASQQNIDLEVALNSELLGKELIVSYESPDWTGTEELDYTVSDGRIQFQIPNLEFYGVVSIGEVGD